MARKFEQREHTLIHTPQPQNYNYVTNFTIYPATKHIVLLDLLQRGEETERGYRSSELERCS
jgi:hypothetical protein